MRSSWLIATVAVALFATASDSAWARGCGGGGRGRGGRHNGGGCGASTCGGGCGGARHHRGGGGCGTSCGGCGSMAGCGGCGGCGGAGYAGEPVTADYGAVAEAAPSDAILIVHLPENARLSVDDHATTSVSDVRMFRTPELAAGTVYHYTLRAEITQDGKTQTVTRRVSIRRGEETHVNLDFASQVASAR